MVTAIPLLLFSLWFSMFDANPARSITINPISERSYISSFSQIGRPQTDLSITKRRVPIRPQGSKPFSAAPVNTNTIRFFKFEYVFTDEQLINAMLKAYHQVAAVMLVGMEVEQQAIAFRVGAFTLNFYDVVEALSQSIVLAVLRRLVQMI